MRGCVGRPRRRPDAVVADRGYDHDKYRRELRARGNTPQIARRQSEHRPGLGRVRWVVERTFAHLHHFKRLLVRFDAAPRSTRPSSSDPCITAPDPSDAAVLVLESAPGRRSSGTVSGRE